MKAVDISRRLHRLVDGKGSPRDFDALFLFIREKKRSFGNRIVEDIGHFVAHADQREKGIAWDRISQFAAMARFMLPRQESNETRTLKHLRAACEASLELHSEDDVRSAFGSSKTKVKTLLDRALDNIASFNGQMVIPKRPPTDREKRLIEHFAGMLVVRPAFVEDDLVLEFVRCVAKNGMMPSGGVPALFRLRTLLSLYVVEKMHLSRILLRDGTLVTLQSRAEIMPLVPGVEVKTPLISVSGAVQLAIKEAPIGAAFDVYSSTLDARDWCGPELLVPGSKAWQFPLEIGPDWKLRLLP